MSVALIKIARRAKIRTRTWWPLLGKARGDQHTMSTLTGRVDDFDKCIEELESEGFIGALGRDVIVVPFEVIALEICGFI